MKNRILFLGAIVLAMVFGSCTKDDFDLGSGRYGVGEAINFGAYIDYGHDTRTSYGELKDGYYPVYWEDNDEVHIFSPHASIGTVDADGKVTITQEGNAAANYTVSGVGNTDVETHPMSGGLAMAWGENDVHDFYTFYPVSKVYPAQTVKESAFVATVPREQTVTVSKTETVTEGDVTYNVTRMVDMQSAIMAGHKQVKRSEGGKITLPFKPLTTAVDIVIDAPTFESGTTPTYNTVTITSIQIANAADEVTNRKGITGGFKVFPSTNEKGEITFSCSDYTPSSSVAEDVQSTFLNIDFGANGYTMTCVNADNKTRDRLIVTGFLLPYDLPEKLRVIVHCKENVNSGASNFISKTISSSTNNATVADQAGKKFTIKLGAIKTPIEFNYSTWMANLPDDTYVSQISMPGTHDAGAYPADTDSGLTNFFTDLFAQTQEISIIEQLNQGVRVLDFRPKYRTSSNDFNIAHGAATYNNRTFDIVMNDMLSWLAEHPTEFVIVLLKNEYGVGDWDTSTNKPVFLGWIKNINAKLRTADYAKYTIAEFNPEMTLKEARGKMLYMSRDYYAPTNISDAHYANVSNNWSQWEHSYTDWYGCKISGWPDNKKQSEAGQKSFFVRNPESVYDPTKTDGNEQKTVGKFYYSDYYKRTIIIDLAVTASNKKTEIQDALTSAKNNSGSDYKDVWYMTWLNVYGSNESRSNTHNSETATYITNNFSTGDTYHRTGIVMADWISNTEGKSLVKAVVDNNFKGGGPAQKTN